MRPNILLEKLRAGDVLLGLCNMYPAAGIIEGMCPGYDFVWIDGQHGQMDYASALHAVRAAAGVAVESIVRVPGHERGVLGTFADMAPSGLLIPMVNTPEQARHIVDCVRFPPLGNRSYGGRRVIDLDGRCFHEERELAILAQIETVEAVENVEEIAGTEGIDALFFGPDDMKCQMGIPVNTDVLENDRLKAAIARTAEAARAAGKFCAGVARSDTHMRAYVELGYRALVCGSDIGYLLAGSRESLESMRSSAGAAAVAAKAKGDTGLYGG